MTAKRQAEVIPKPLEDAAGSAGSFAKEPEEQLEHLRGLLERSEVEAARAFVKELERQWPESDRVAYWVRVLAPPKAAVVQDQRVRCLDRERDWLREHAHEYPGRWLALLHGELIAASPDLRSVLAAARQRPDGERALLHFQPGTPEPK